MWRVDPDYDIFTARPDGSDLRRLTRTPGYDAEATLSTDERWIVFTSNEPLIDGSSLRIPHTRVLTTGGRQGIGALLDHEELRTGFVHERTMGVVQDTQSGADHEP